MLTWQGRRLASISGEEGTDYTYTYNDEGIRTGKTVNGVEHIYHLSGTQILSEEWTENGVQYLIVYSYDASGYPISMTYRKSTDAATAAEVYFLASNPQGDITYIYDIDGNRVVTYNYDAWGNILSITGTKATTIGRYNPFRYRGYYYDTETGLYYLNSRYYDPAVGRFLNADVYINGNGDIIGFNLFAYCGNNPVMGYDPDGTINWRNIIIAVVVVVAVTAVVAATVATAGAFAVAAGAVSATVATAATTGAIVGGLAAGSMEIIMQCLTKGSDNLDYGSIAIETFTGSVHGALDGVASTATSIGTRIGCKAGKVVLSGINTSLHGINNGDSATDIGASVARSLGGSFVMQAGLLGVDCYNGYFAENVLSQRMLDGAANYGATQMVGTALIRGAANLWRNRKDIWRKIYE